MDFETRLLISLIGRKELEEFGIVNLGTALNKFQKGKSALYSSSGQGTEWNLIQERWAQIILQAAEVIMSYKPVPWKEIIPTRRPGIYLVWEYSGNLIYVGESTSLQERYMTHNSRTRFSALRRHIATEVLSFQLKTKKELGITSSDAKRAFLTDSEERAVSDYLSECMATMQDVQFGRLELEEYIIKTCKPLLNRKGNLKNKELAS